MLLARAPGSPDVVPFDKPSFSRLNEAELAVSARGSVSADAQATSEPLEQMYAPIPHGERIRHFLATEGVRAVIVPSGNRLAEDSSVSLRLYGRRSA